MAAATWAARVDRGPLSEDEQRALEVWAAGDPRRAGAYAKARAVSAHFDRAQALGPDFAPQRHPVAVGRTRRRMLIGGAGLTAAAFVGVGAYQWNRSQDRITTRKGDIRRVPLSDGSAVTLNTNTVIRTEFEKQVRRVDLLRGEASFDVAKDAARPFVVVAGAARVRAIGTSFTVRTWPDGAVEVLVQEGVVEVSRGTEAPVRLSADFAAKVTPTSPLRALALPVGEVERATAWRQGLLDLDGLTLAQAAEEYERYTDRRIQIDDPALGKLKMTGLFSVSDPDGFARAAALSLGLSATSTPDGVRLSAAPR